MANIPNISIVVPVFNSEKIIPELIKRIECLMESSGLDYELIMVNDKSSDQSYDVLNSFANRNNKLIVLHNEKNLGQAYTSIKGIALSKGEFIVTIDDDLEYDPADILNLFKKITKENCLIVFGIAANKYKLQGKSTFLAQLRNKVLNFVWNKPVTDSFKIFKRSLVFKDHTCLLKEPFEVFIKNKKLNHLICYQNVGFNKRFEGVSNYTLYKKVKLFFQMSKIFK